MPTTKPQPAPTSKVAGKLLPESVYTADATITPARLEAVRVDWRKKVKGAGAGLLEATAKE